MSYAEYARRHAKNPEVYPPKIYVESSTSEVDLEKLIQVHEGDVEGYLQMGKQVTEGRRFADFVLQVASEPWVVGFRERLNEVYEEGAW